MNRSVKTRLQAFQKAQRRTGQYHISQYTPHESAIREHIARGFGAGLTRIEGLLDQNNRIDSHV